MQNRPLSRDFYSFAIFFVASYIVVSLIQAVISLLLGSRFITFQSFHSWLAVLQSVFAISSFALLKYYWSKGYKVVFATALVSTLVLFAQMTMIYFLLMHRDLKSFYMNLTVAGLVLNVLYGTSLVFSNAGQRPWLKRGGWLAILTGIPLCVIALWSIRSQDIELRLLLDKTYRVIAFFGILVPVTFLLDLLIESKSLNNERERKPVILREALKVAAIISILFFGMSFVGESYRSGTGRAYVPSMQVLKQTAEFGPRHYVDHKGDTLRYRLVPPVAYDSTKKYPLVVCLHHGGAHGKDNVRQLSADPAPFLLSDSIRWKYPAFILIPHCPEGAGFGGISEFPDIDTLVFETITTLEKEYSIDTTRRYVMGISGGGYGSWHFISTRPDMFAAAIPICGAGHPELANRLTKKAIWAFHGAKDPLVSVNATRDMIHAIEKAGGKPKYTEFGNSGHDIWRYVQAEPGLMTWLFAQKQ